MSIFSQQDLPIAEALAAISYTNPFTEERPALEKKVLGDAFIDDRNAWVYRQKNIISTPNLAKFEAVNAEVAEKALANLKKTSIRRNDTQLGLYVDVVLSHLFNHSRLPFIQMLQQGQVPDTIEFYHQFREDYDRFFKIKDLDFPDLPDAPHLFALCYQIHRAFHYTFSYIIGGSPASRKLRVDVWNSIFSHDLKRYRRTLYKQMHDITTLITGPSGTGKELVARAIALSRYVPFFPQRLAFKNTHPEDFFPLHLSALSENLIESELFGHKRGAYTGALEDRVGWLELCPDHGTVFLDEIGEVSPAIQVKLLRVLQNRQFQRLGETQLRPFHGKIIAATNRNLETEIESGNFRGDLFYRLCADRLVTPSLSEQLSSSEELNNYLLYLAQKWLPASEANQLAEESYQWIRKNLPHYTWPGNVRELEQCMRNILLRGHYQPMGQPKTSHPGYDLDHPITADQLLNNYCKALYQRHPNYRQVARLVELDWRTVRTRVDSED